MAVIKIGASAWTEKTLVASGWYPKGARDAAGKLRYYATQFPVTEVDATYYALPTRRQAEVWAARTPEDFTFDVKAYAPLTSHYTDTHRLPKDLLAELPVELRDQPKLYPKEIPSELFHEIVRRFRDALAPLRESNKLGVVLFQYPVWFPFSQDNLAELAWTHEWLPGHRIAVEFRNYTWMSERHGEETLRFLEANDLIYTCVDEPQGFSSSVPPLAAVTNTLSVVRFHGRNQETWKDTSGTAADRMDYLYSESELREWLPRLAQLAERAHEIHVIMNNCAGDFAVRNAAQLRALVE